MMAKMAPGRVQRQRAVNTSPATWAAVQRVARDQGCSAAEVVGDALEELVARGNPHPVTEREHDAVAPAIVDGCGIDNSFNEGLSVIDHWLTEYVAGVGTERERRALTRRLKVALNRLEARDLRANGSRRKRDTDHGYQGSKGTPAQVARARHRG